MNRRMPTMVGVMAALLGGMTPSGSSIPGPRDDGKHKRSTNELVVCKHCDAYCEPGKGCGAKAQAILTGWKKLGDREFLCPECRKETVEKC